MFSRKITNAEWSILLLGSAIILFFASFGIKLLNANSDLLDLKLTEATTLSQVTTAAHAQFGASVKGLSDHPGVKFTTTPDPENGNLHFPATFTSQLSQRLAEINPDSTFNIYSDDPFMSSRNRELDPFQRAALQAFRSGGQDNYWEVQKSDEGSQLLRFAVPMRMSEGCVACHNLPQWGLAKQDWAVGDIRGARETVLKFPSFSFRQHLDSIGILVSAALLFLMGIYMGYQAIRREVDQRAKLENLSSQLHEKNRTLEGQALTDPLSGLRNRRYFDAALEEYITEFRKIGGTVSLITFDLDNFKQINDKYGHAVGDLVIQEFAACIQENAREYDVTARIGGEEFALLVGGTQIEDAKMLAERIRIAVSKVKIKAATGLISITTSGGHAVLAPGDTASSLQRIADTNLYKSKRRGRNQITFDDRSTMNAAA